MNLNSIAVDICDRMADSADRLRVAVDRDPSGARVVDCGVRTPGGLEAGRLLATICMAGLGQVHLAPDGASGRGRPLVTVRTDHPLAACMAAQYAGWHVSYEGYFAMASGPMRAVAAREALFDTIGHRQDGPPAVGVLETSRLPPPSVCRHIADRCGIESDRLTLLVAPTASLAGTLQVVARSVETAMHKLHELEFDLHRVIAGFGAAPLPPVADGDLAAMGRANDAILYGGEVTLWVHGEGQDLRQIGSRVPSGASKDHGRPFAEIFQRYDRDFYAIDPGLFGPAVLNLWDLDSGRSFRFGRLMPEVLAASFTS